jgi:hypothetical protein
MRIVWNILKSQPTQVVNKANPRYSNIGNYKIVHFMTWKSVGGESSRADLRIARTHLVGSCWFRRGLLTEKVWWVSVGCMLCTRVAGWAWGNRALGKTWKGEQEGNFNGDRAPRRWVWSSSSVLVEEGQRTFKGTDYFCIWGGVSSE